MELMQFIEAYGLIALFATSFLAATVVPFSSEVALTALLVAGVSPISLFIVATLGNWLGGLTSYFIGHLGSWRLIERWFGVKRERLLQEREKISKYGALLAFVTWLPLVGDLLSIALGFYRVSFYKSALFMLIGRATRFLIWIFLYLRYGERLFSHFMG